MVYPNFIKKLQTQAKLKPTTFVNFFWNTLYIMLAVDSMSNRGRDRDKWTCRLCSPHQVMGETNKVRHMKRKHPYKTASWTKVISHSFDVIFGTS